MHKDYLNWDLFIPHVLFSFWSIDGGVQMFFSCLIVGFISFFHELLKPTSSSALIALLLLGIDDEELVGLSPIGQLCWYCIRTYFSYSVMLIVMTFNMFLISAIVLGYGIGMLYKNACIHSAFVPETILQL